MEKKTIYRSIIYIIGLLILAMGLVLNTKAGLGVSPIISVAFCASELTGISFGDTTLAWYSVLVLVEMIIHLKIVEKKRLKKVLITDALQIVLSLIFTRFVNLFGSLFPTAEQLAPGNLGVKIMVLLMAIVLTGCGAAMSLDVRIIPNPGDGIVQVVSDLLGKSVGLMKNCVDISCVTITCIVGMLLAHRIIGVGIGTVMAMILIGRIVAIFNHFYLAKIKALM